MQPRRHRMRQKHRRQSALGWIQSGATVTIKAYARRYGVDRYTAYEDLIALGFPLPASAQRWAHRPPPTPRHGRTDADLPGVDWIMMDGRPYFVAGYTSAGFPYGIYVDEVHDLGDMQGAEACDDMPCSRHTRALDEPHGGPPSRVTTVCDRAFEGDPF
jgi:hypothetical protein